MTIHVRRRLNPQALSRQASEVRRGIQIGPRIRVGGTLGKIGQKVKEGVGKLDKAAAPFVAMIPGVGQIAAPIMNMAGTVLDTSHGGVSLGDLGKAGLQSAGMYGAGKLLSGVTSHIPGVSSFGQRLESLPGAGAIKGAVHQIGQIPGVSEIGGAIKGAVMGQPATAEQPGSPGLLGSAIDYAKAHPLDVLSAINSTLDAAHARDLQGQAESMAMGNYNDRAGLRTAGMQGMLKPAVPDLSGVDYGSSGSVYGKRKKLLPPAAGVY